jgi:hypothetical protein
MEPYTYSDQYFKDFKTKQPMIRMLGEGANKLAQRVNPAVGAATAYQVANLGTDLATGYNIDERLTDVASRGMNQQGQYASMSAPFTSFDFLGTNVNTENMPITKTGTTAVGQAQNLTTAPVDQYGSTISALGEQGMQQARQNQIMNQEINEPVSSLASDTAYGVTPSYGTLDKIKAPSTVPDYTGYSSLGNVSDIYGLNEVTPGFKEPEQRSRIGQFAETAGDVAETIVRTPLEVITQGTGFLFGKDRPGFSPLQTAVEKSFASQNTATQDAVTQDAAQKDAEIATAVTEDAQKPQTLMPEGFDETGTKIDPQTGKPLEVAMTDAEKLQLARDFGLREDLGFRYDPSTGAITREQEQLAPGLVRAIEYGGADVFKRYNPAEQRFEFVDASGNLVGEDLGYARERERIRSEAQRPRLVGGPETTIRRDSAGGLSKNDFRRIAKAKFPNASRRQISAMAEQMMLEQQQKAATTDLAAQKAAADIAKTKQMTDYYEAATGAKLAPDTDTRAMTSVEQKQAVLKDLQPILSKYRSGEELTDADKNKLAVANLLFPATGSMTQSPIEEMFGDAGVFEAIMQGTPAPPPPPTVTTPTVSTAPTVNSKEGKQRIKGVKKDNPKATEEQIISTLLDKGLLLPEE